MGYTGGSALKGCLFHSRSIRRSSVGRTKTVAIKSKKKVVKTDQKLHAKITLAARKILSRYNHFNFVSQCCEHV